MKIATKILSNPCLLRLIGICSTNIGPGYCSGQGLKISEPYIEQHAQSNDEN